MPAPFQQSNVIDVLKSIFDPEIPVDIYELGLIYEVKITEDGFVHIQMTLTSPNCPVAESLPADVEEKVGKSKGLPERKSILFSNHPGRKT